MGDTHVSYTVQGKAESVHLHTTGLSQRQTTNEFQRRHHSRPRPGDHSVLEFIRDFKRLKMLRKKP